MIREELFRLRPLTLRRQTMKSDSSTATPSSYFINMEPQENVCVFERRRGDSPAARARITE